MEYTFEITVYPMEKESSLIREQLFSYNLQFTEHDLHTPLKIFTHHANVELIAGLLGENYWR